MVTRFWHGSRLKRHFSSWGRRSAGDSTQGDGPVGGTARSQRMDPSIAREARHSDYPDVSTYDRPATTRMTPANLGLSIVLLISAVVVCGVILWAIFR
jgi:hypothetical protein